MCGVRKRVVWLGRGKAQRRPAAKSFAPVVAGPPRLVFHNEGVDRRCPGKGHDFAWLADYTAKRGIYYHALWCPDCGKVVQTAPFDRAARSLKSGNLDGRGTSPNRYGPTIQVCVVGYGMRPFTRSKMVGARLWGKVAKSWGVAPRLRKVWGASASRSAAAWRRGGIHGHCHSPGYGEDHIDPGAIDVRRLKRAMYP